MSLTDADPFSSSQGKSSSGSSVYTSLPQAIDGVMSLALCPYVVLKLHRSKLDSTEMSGTVGDLEESKGDPFPFCVLKFF